MKFSRARDRPGEDRDHERLHDAIDNLFAIALERLDELRLAVVSDTVQYHAKLLKDSGNPEMSESIAEASELISFHRISLLKVAVHIHGDHDDD